jgi:hypothetical protein
MPTAVKTYKCGDIWHLSKSPKQLFRRGVFPDNGRTLLNIWQGYFGSPQVRNGIHEGYGSGEWLSDVIDTDDAGETTKGRLNIVYIKRPEYITLREGKYGAEGGKRINYNCPPDGWVIPADGILRHPKTGAALATIDDREKAVKENARYIEKHTEQFAGWTIPARWQKEFDDIFKEDDVDLADPTPPQLAEFITSYQWAPMKNTGLVAAWRRFKIREDGPFCVGLFTDPVYS